MSAFGAFLTSMTTACRYRYTYGRAKIWIELRPHPSLAPLHVRVEFPAARNGLPGIETHGVTPDGVRVLTEVLGRR